MTRICKRCMDIDSLSVLRKQMLSKIIKEFELVKKSLEQKPQKQKCKTSLSRSTGLLQWPQPVSREEGTNRAHMMQLTHICQQQTCEMSSPWASTLHLIKLETKKELAETKWNIWKDFQRESSHEDT